MHFPSKPLGEFDLIQRFFKAGAEAMDCTSNVSLGIGDDCALIKPINGEELAVTTDMLVEGRHFFTTADPEQLGSKALAVNLSDLSAMGAKPIGFTLALALPNANAAWLEAFSRGLFRMATRFSCPLIGGDTTAGPLNISITALGSIPTGKAIRRSGARPGDDIWISGELGDARLALAALRHEILLPYEDLKLIEQRMHCPSPRVELGMALREIASSALDISDGLLGDLGHIQKQSQVDAQILIDQLPKSAILQKQSAAIQNQFATAGGDDYEICFTADPKHRIAIENLGQSLQLPLTRIGHTLAMQNSHPKLELLSNGRLLSDADSELLLKSFDHFSL